MDCKIKMKNIFILLFSIIELTACCAKENEKSRVIDFSHFEQINGTSVYELSDRTDRLIIQNVPIGTEIYITKTNTSGNVIPIESAQYVLEAEGITRNVRNPKKCFENDKRPPASVFAPQKIFRKTERVKTFNQNKEADKRNSRIIAEKDYETGSFKDIYIDANSNMTVYEKASACLSSKGKFCYVWTVNGSASSDRIAAAADCLCSAFDTMYEKIQSLFGKESDLMFCSYNGKFFDMKNMKYMSDTGNKVNIVLYDISRENNGVVGYFYSKDYFPRGMDYENNVLNYSNEGKYIYIDSQWAEADINICISTLAHEFQHMINYNQKTILHDLPDADALSEMMSLLCEDIITRALTQDSHCSIQDTQNAVLNTEDVLTITPCFHILQTTLSAPGCTEIMEEQPLFTDLLQIHTQT